jgi:hypothetical protein
MKQLFTTLIVLGICVSNSFAQITCQPPVYYFNNKSNVSGTGGLNSVYKFSNVLTGFDAFVTITKIQNASITNNNMDQSSGYSQAWQPYITFPSSRNNNSDSSYMEFKIEFRSNTIQGAPLSDQACMSLTIVDLDGNGQNSYREMVKISNPGSPRGILNSTISVYDNTQWMTFISGTATFNNIDSANKAAMSQVNFPPTVNTIYLRAGVLGRISANTTRQYSFYFKSFTGLVVPLPVHISNFNVAQINDQAQLSWNGSSENNFSHFEVLKSFDGIDYVNLGKVVAQSANNGINVYRFTDINANLQGVPVVFYKLKMVDNNGEFTYTNVVALDHVNTVLNTLSNIYPNPSSTQVTLDLGYQPYDDFKVQITDVYGKLLYEASNPELNGTKTVIDVSAFDQGIYQMKVENADGSIYSSKFTKL